MDGVNFASNEVIVEQINNLESKLDNRLRITFYLYS